MYSTADEATKTPSKAHKKVVNCGISAHGHSFRAQKVYKQVNALQNES